MASVSDFLVLLGVLRGVELTTGGVDPATCIASGGLISGVSGRGARLRMRQFMKGLLVFGVEMEVSFRLVVMQPIQPVSAKNLKTLQSGAAGCEKSFSKMGSESSIGRWPQRPVL